MNDIILNSVVVLGILGALAAAILFLVSKKFYVYEDPKIDEVNNALPNTNCGGCGFPGCKAFAEELCDKKDLESLHCPVGGNEVMKEVAAILGVEAVEKEPYVAVVKCAGTNEYREKKNRYDGIGSCTAATNLYGGDTGCQYGCLGLGDCVQVCEFDAMYIDDNLGIPIVDDEKCTACNACVVECPKDIMDLWPVGKKNQRVYVACKNEEKGGIARKECALACSGCAKCSDECRYDAITIENNLASVNFEQCKLCLKCVEVCDVRVMMSDNVPEEKIDKLRESRLKREEKEKEKARQERAAAKEQNQKDS